MLKWLKKWRLLFNVTDKNNNKSISLLAKKNGMFQQQKTHWQIHHLFIEMNKFIQ